MYFRFKYFNLICIVILLFISYNSWYIVNNHFYDLDYEGLFEDRFIVFLMTKNCGRLSQKVLDYFPNLIAISDIKCINNNFDNKTMIFEKKNDNLEINYKLKYKHVIEICKDSDNMLCLIIEDDVTFLHSKEKTRDIIVDNTISLFTNEGFAYDCSKRGFLLTTGMDNNKSLCRIIAKEYAKCLIKCFDKIKEPADITLGFCQDECGIKQKRFLIVQHSGKKSLLNH